MFSRYPRNYTEPFTGSQTVENVYLCFDLCTGGDLFDRVHYYARGKYHEKFVSHTSLDLCLTSLKGRRKSRQDHLRRCCMASRVWYHPP